MESGVAEPEKPTGETGRRGIYRQYLATSIACLAVFCQGNVFGWIPPLIPKVLSGSGNGTEPLMDDVFIDMTGDQTSWLISLISLGGVLAPIPCGHLMDTLGRKPVILLTAPLLIAAWVLALALPTLNALYAVRIIQGVASGCIFIAVPVYIGEVGHASVRGTMISIVPGVWTVGLLYEYVTVPYLSYRTAAYTSCVFPFLLLLGFWWLPESPHFLLMKGKPKKAAESLAWFRGCASVDEVSDELSSAKTSVYRGLERNKAGWRQLFCTKKGLKCTFILHGVACSGMLGGGITILMFAEKLFPESSPFEANVGAVSLCLLTLASEVSVALLIDRLGRRPIILYSYWGTALFTFAASVVYYFSPPTDQVFHSDSWTSSLLRVAPYLVILPANFLLSVQMATSSSAMRVELFPTESRALASAILSISSSFLFLIVVKVFQWVKDGLGLYVNFLLFTFFNIGGALIAYFFLPETKKKTFEAIQSGID